MVEKAINPKFDYKQQILSTINYPFKNLPRIQQLAFIKDEIVFVLDDGRVIYIPLEWSEKLSKATESQRLNFKNTGIHIFWDDIDEIIGVKNILLGNKLFI